MVEDGEDGEEADGPSAGKSPQLQALVAAYSAWQAATPAEAGDLRTLSHTRAVRYVHMLRRTGRYDEAWALALRLVEQDGFRMSLAFAAVLARLLRRSRNFQHGYAVYVRAKADPPVSILLRPLLRLSLEPPVNRESLVVAMEIFKRMSEIRFLLSGDYVLMARALVSKGFLAEALDVYERMVAHKFYADDYVDLACELIQEAFHAWDPPTGWRIYELARDNGIPLTTRALRTVIVLCLSDHNTDRALDVYTAMLARLYVRANREPPVQLRSRTAAELVAYIDELAAALSATASGGGAPQRTRPASGPQQHHLQQPERRSNAQHQHHHRGQSNDRPPPAVRRSPSPRLVARPANAAAAAPATSTPADPPRAREDDKGKADLVYPVMYLMKIAASQGDPDLIRRMMERLPDWRLRPDKAHHAALIAAHAAAGQLDRATAMLDAPADPALGFVPTTALYGILVDEALRHGDVAAADAIANRALASSGAAAPTAYFFVRLILLYGRAGHTDHAWRWYRQMRARGWYLQDARARSILSKPNAAGARGGSLADLRSTSSSTT